MQAPVPAEVSEPAARRDGVGWWRNAALLRALRWCALIVWGVALGREWYLHGIPFDREGLILWIMLGAAAATIGKRAVWTVLVDWLPFVAVLIAYDYLRGLSDKLGMPTWWQPQIDVDRWLFFGTEPTVWLQAHIKYPKAQWWDVVVTLVYISFFFLPYVTAGVLWLRSRTEFRRWAARFVTLSFLGFAFFALIPAAPPWAAARCTAADVAHHPATPSCIYNAPQYMHGGMLGAITHQSMGANPWIEDLSGRGFSYLHLEVAKSLLDKGHAAVDLVAAVPSLHAGGTMLFVLFFWRRANRWVRGVLALYAVLMGFALVYSAEHYACDVLAGWLCAAAVSFGFDALERRRARAKSADRLGGTDSPSPAPSSMENEQCPPIGTTPSST